jgi:hypothetical protein
VVSLYADFWVSLVTDIELSAPVLRGFFSALAAASA